MNERDIQTNSVSRRPRRRWGNPFFIILVLVVLAGAVSLAKYFYETHVVFDELEEAIAETDRLDPGWRLEELEAKRQVIADKDNAALRVLGSSKFLPDKWFDKPVYDELAEIEPPVLLNDQQAAAMREVLDKLKPALNKARTLKSFPSGRYTVHWRDDVFSTLVPHLEQVRSVNRLLVWDATLRAHDNDLHGAWASTHAALNAARSIGDEPLLISLLVRHACGLVAVQSMERMLAQGQPAEKALAETQKLLEDETVQPAYLIAMRGERASLQSLMTNLQAGKVTLDQITGGPRRERSFVEKITDFFAGKNIKHNHVWTLNYMTQTIEIIKMPMEEQDQPFQELVATLNDAPPLAKLLLTALDKVRTADKRWLARVRSTFTALAVERYRLVHRRWPKALAELVPAQLKTVPTDPYDAMPLRYRRLPDGVVVYSIGPDGEDNGGNLDRKSSTTKGTDLGFRLWDVTKRRQPAKPAKPMVPQMGKNPPNKRLPNPGPPLHKR